MAQLELVKHERFSQQLLETVRSGSMDEWTSERLIEWGFEHFAPRIALSASFGLLYPAGVPIWISISASTP